jgi:hypothetical protein
MNVRRCAAVPAAAVLITAGAAPVASGDAAPSAKASTAPPAGLYGRADPTYDGTFRQSYALLAQHTAGVRPAPSAVGRLPGQQCAHDGFAAFRAGPVRACDGHTPVDSNSTAAAVQTLAALGGHGAVSCRDQNAAKTRRVTGNGVRYLLDAFTNGGYLTSVLPGSKDQPDYGNTADAVVALAAAGRAGEARAALSRLERHGPGRARGQGPAAWAQLIFAAHATGTDPRRFGTTDLVKALNATGPAPFEDRAVGGPGAGRSADGGSFALWWALGAVLVVLAAAGLVLRTRARRSS